MKSLITTTNLRWKLKSDMEPRMLIDLMLHISNVETIPSISGMCHVSTDFENILKYDLLTLCNEMVSEEVYQERKDKLNTDIQLIVPSIINVLKKDAGTDKYFINENDLYYRHGSEGSQYIFSYNEVKKYKEDTERV